MPDMAAAADEGRVEENSKIYSISDGGRIIFFFVFMNGHVLSEHA